MRIFSTLLCLCLSTTLFSQLQVGNLQMDFGATASKADGDVIQIAGESNGLTYALAKESKTYFLQTYRMDNQDFVKEVEIDLEKIEKNKVTLEDMAVIDGNPFLFASYFHRKDDKRVFIAYPISENLTLGSPKSLLSVPVDKKNEAGGFIFKLSYSEASYLVTHVRILPRDESMKYEFVLFDRDLKAIHSEKESLTFKDRKDLFFSLDDITVNQQGDIFVVVSDSYRDRKKKTTFTNLTINTFYKDKGYKKEVVNIDLKGKKVLNCNAISTLDGKLQVIGFYSNLRKSGRSDWRLEGIFNVALDTEDNTVSKEVFNEFTIETKTKLIGERRAKKGKDLKPNYRNTHFIERENGGVIVMSEWFTVVQGSSAGIGPLAVTNYVYSTNEIIVTALNEDGTLAWSNVVPKEQQATVSVLSIGFFSGAASGPYSVGFGLYFPLAVMGDGPEFLSAMPMYENGVLSILVNDDPKNIGTTSIDDVKKVRNIKKMIPVLFNFDDSNGAMSRIDPEEFEKRQLVIRPYVNYRIGEKEYLIYATNKEGKHLGRLQAID